MDLVKDPEGKDSSLVPRGVFTKKGKAINAERSKNYVVLPVRLNQLLSVDYFTQNWG